MSDRYGDLFANDGEKRGYHDLLVEMQSERTSHYKALLEDTNSFAKFERELKTIKNNHSPGSSAEVANLCDKHLGNKFFAAGAVNSNPTAFIFDNVADCLVFCQKNSPAFEEMNFSAFKTKFCKDYKNANNYSFDKDYNYIIFRVT